MRGDLMSAVEVATWVGLVLFVLLRLAIVVVIVVFVVVVVRILREPRYVATETSKKPPAPVAGT